MTDDLDFPITQSPESRQEERQSNLPAIYRTKHERLACELAMGMGEPEQIFKDYGFSEDEAIALTDSPAFTALLARVGSEIRESGLSFKSKIKAIAEDLIPHALDMATDPLCSSAVRADIIKWSAKMAGFEPAPPKADTAQGAGGFTLSITFAGQQPQQIVSGREPLTIEQD